ncbi:MAG: two-component regulator propeller domain-containing protein [Cyclobacteriaceae bacterium]
MYKGIKRILSLTSIVFLLSPEGAISQEGLNPNKRLTQYIIDSWTTENGIPNNGILDIEKTNDGYLWIATYSGLARFDGTNFTEFPELLAVNGIRSLQESTDGFLWIGSDDGSLIKYKDDVFSFIDIGEDLVSPVITSISENHNGKMWIGTRSGMAVVEDDVLQRVDHPMLSQAFVYCSEIDAFNNLWIGTSGLGLFKYSANGVVEQYTVDQGLVNNSVRSIHVGNEGQLMVGTEGGLTLFENGKPSESYTTANGLPHNYVNEILHDSQGTTWLGTDHGLVRFRDGVIDVLDNDQGLADNTIQALSEDGEGILWVGTYFGGLNRLKDGKFINYGLLEGLQDEVVYVTHEGEGKVWIGTANGISYLEKGKVTSNKLGDFPAINTIRDILCDSRRQLWIGTSAGLVLYQNGRIVKRITTREGLSNNRVRRISEAQNGDLWIGTAKGLNRYSVESGEMRSYGTAHGLSNEFILSLLVDSQDRVWVGTNGGGLLLLQDDTFQSFADAEGLESNIIFGIDEDQNGTLWVSTNSGITRYKDEKFQSITKTHGLPSNTVFQVIINDYFWLFTDKGLVRIDRNEVQHLLDNQIRSLSTTLLLNKSEGMRTDQVTGVSVSDSSSEGHILVSTLRGLSILDPTKLEVSNLATKVMLTSVLSDGLELKDGDDVRFGPGTRYNEFHYAALNFYAPEKIKFRYRLENFDEGWIEAGDRRTAYYSNLPPGEYTFQVLASNTDGVWNDKPVEFHFCQEAYFYETAWFYVLLAFTLGGAIFLLYKARVRTLHVSNKQLQELVELRTQDVQNQNNELTQLNHIKDRLFSIISHDLRSPINSCYSLLDVMGKGEISDDEFKKLGKILTLQIGEVKDLLNDLLNWSRSQLDGLTITPEKISLSPIVEENFKLFEMQASHKELELENSLPGTQYVSADMNMTKVVVRNLISNAIKFSKKRGSIKVGCVKKNGVVEFSVKDHGVGIGQDNLTKIFDKELYTTAGTVDEKGTGIGLILVKEFVEKNGGTVEVESIEGEGSTFRFTLPGA